MLAFKLLFAHFYQKDQLVLFVNDNECKLRENAENVTNQRFLCNKKP
jgi:hypothetical protein